MKLLRRFNSSIFIYFFLIFSAFFILPQSTYAQNGDCGTGPARIDLPIYIYDQNGNRWGQSGSACTNDAYEGIGFSRVSGTRAIYFTCNANGGRVQNAFVAESYRCDDGNFVFNISTPSSYPCSGITWRYHRVGTLGSSSSPDTNPPVSGTGCRISVPYQGNDFDRQVIIRMTNTLPDPQRISATCNTNETVTLRWNGVAGASQYGWRLNNLANGWGTFNGNPTTTDSYGNTAGTTISVPLRYGQNYQWTVTSLNASGQGPFPSSWSGTFSCNVPEPSGRTYTCNDNQTITLRWNAVPQANRYVPRLNRIGNPDSWRNIGQGDTGANFPGINATSVTYPIVYGANYSWAVSATSSSNVSSAWTWSSNFACGGVNISTRNSSGTAVAVRGLAYTYNGCGATRTCIGGSRQNSSSGSFRSISGWQGGAGIALNSNQRIIGVSPAPAGGSLIVRGPNNPANAAWENQVVWNNYWWNPYPAGAGRNVNFVIATITPPLTCGTVTASSSPARVGTAFNARLSGVNSTTTGCNLLFNGSSVDTGNSVGNPRRCDMNTTVRNGVVSYNIRATNGANNISCATASFCGDSTAPPVPGGRALTCTWARYDGTNNRYNVSYSYTGVTDTGCVGMSSTPYWAQLSNNSTFATTINSDNTWQGGAAGLTTSVTDRTEGQTVYARVRSRDGLDNQSAWSTSTSFQLNPTNCNGVPTPTAVPPTPTPAYWFKLRDTSFNRVTADTLIRIPNNPLRFNTNDADDPGPTPFLIIGRNGVVTTNNNLTISGGGQFSTNRSYKNSYTINTPHIQNAASLNAFRSSLVATKDWKSITSVTQIEANKVNIRSGGNLTINTNQVPNGNYVIFVEGNVNMNVGGGLTRFGQTNQSIAIIATGTVFIHQNISEVNGILIAPNVQLVASGVSAAQPPPLKINGNLVSTANVNYRMRLSPDQRNPSLFVVFKPQMYLDLLPLLSTVVQEGRQIE